MKFLKGIFLILIFCVKAQAAPEDPRLPVHRLRVLHSRLHEVLSYRQTALAQCAKSKNDLGAAALASRVQDHISKIDQSESMVLELLDEYKTSIAFESLCAKEIQSADRQLFDRERRLTRFPLAGVKLLCATDPLGYQSCMNSFMNAWRDIDPHCALVYDDEFNGGREHNACMAGETIMTREMFRDDPDQIQFTALIDELRNGIRNAPAEGRLEWLSLIKGDPRNNAERMKLFKFVANFYIAGNSVLGYMDDYVDEIWRESLRSGAPAVVALNRYNLFKQSIDQGYYLIKDAKKKHLKLTFNGQDVTNANHHTYISAVLGCRFAGDGRFFAEGLPVALGMGYETKDFITDWSDNGRVTTAARTKFKLDMGRNRQGARLGFDFCTGND